MQPLPLGESGGGKTQGRTAGRGLTRPARSAAQEGWGYPVGRAQPSPLRSARGWPLGLLPHGLTAQPWAWADVTRTGGGVPGVACSSRQGRSRCCWPRCSRQGALPDGRDPGSGRAARSTWPPTAATHCSLLVFCLLSGNICDTNSHAGCTRVPGRRRHQSLRGVVRGLGRHCSGQDHGRPRAHRAGQPFQRQRRRGGDWSTGWISGWAIGCISAATARCWSSSWPAGRRSGSSATSRPRRRVGRPTSGVNDRRGESWL